MPAALRVLLVVFGGSAVAICASILIVGPTTTAWAFERTFDAVTGWRGQDSPPWPATMDSELRFYAPLFGAYGVVLIRTAGDLAARGRAIPWLAAVLLIGGLGRAVSLASVGAPHPLFLLLMGVELITPAAMAGLWMAARRRLQP